MSRYRFSEQSLSRRRHRRKIWRRNLLIAVVVIIVAGVSSLFFLPSLMITGVNVSGTAIVSSDAVVQSTENILAGRYLFIFPKSDTLVYPKNEIVSSLEKQFPAINSVKISRGGFHGLNIAISERQPAALWCTGFSTSSPCDLMDATGFIFAPAAEISGPSYLRFLDQLATSSPPIGQYYLPAADFQSLFAFLDNLPTLNLQPATIEPLAPSDWQVNLVSSGSLYVSGSESYDDTFANLSTLLSNPTFKSQFTTQKLEYLDLRYGTKIFYKFAGSASSTNQ